MLSISAHCIVQVGNNCNYIFCSVSLLSELSRRMVRHCNWIKSNAEPWMCVRTNDKLHSVQFVWSNSGDRQWGGKIVCRRRNPSWFGEKKTKQRDCHEFKHRYYLPSRAMLFFAHLQWSTQVCMHMMLVMFGHHRRPLANKIESMEQSS